MPEIAELGGLAAALLVELCVRIGRALVGLVRARLAVEIAFGVAAGTITVMVSAILLPEALDRGSGVDERAIDREMFVR